MESFDKAPFLVIWEVTQACDLACLHCRACAMPARDPAELSTEEGFALLKEIRSFGDPLMVFTGGDPLKRPDLLPLLRHSVGLGLRTTVTPSATPLLTRESVRSMAECGVARMAVSLDAADAAAHGRFRGVAGSFDRSFTALDAAREVGLETQINTTVTRHNMGDLEKIAERVADVGARLWSVFFLVATGRASEQDDLTAQEYEQVFAFLYGLSKRAPFDIKTTEAQHYRRYVAQQRKAEGTASPSKRPAPSDAKGPPPAAARFIARHGGINDGKGLVFISHAGDIYPSGFLPISGGNVRSDSLVEVYRESPLFLSLRRTGEFDGKCGECEYRNLCGGSRSRSYALTGDHLGSDPRCIYTPASYAAHNVA